MHATMIEGAAPRVRRRRRTRRRGRRPLGADGRTRRDGGRRRSGTVRRRRWRLTDASRRCWRHSATSSRTSSFDSTGRSTSPRTHRRTSRVAAVAARRTSPWRPPRLGRPAGSSARWAATRSATALLAEMASDGVDVTMVRRAGSTGTIVALVDPTGERSMLTDRRACFDLSRSRPVVARRRRRSSTYRSTRWPVVPVAATATTVIGWAHDRDIDVVDRRVVERRHDRAWASTVFTGSSPTCSPDVVLANRDEATALDIDGPVGRRGHDRQTGAGSGDRVLTGPTARGRGARESPCPTSATRPAPAMRSRQASSPTLGWMARRSRSRRCAAASPIRAAALLTSRAGR